jgi:hypothetical protein
MPDVAVNSTHTFRLGWKGILATAEWLLYSDSDLSFLVCLPLFFLLFLPRLLLSYLRLSSQGLELHYWPNYRVHVPWNAVERLGQCHALGMMRGDALYLHHSRSGASAEILSRTSGLQQKRIIPLSDFRGWPQGQLAQELARFIPEVVD